MHQLRCFSLRCNRRLVPFWGCAASVLLPAALPQPAEAFLVLRMRQVGSDVEITGSGSYSTDELSRVAIPDGMVYPAGNPTTFPTPELQSRFSYLLVGTQSGGSKAWFWSGFAQAPGSPIGTDENLRSGVNTSEPSGSSFGIDGSLGYLLLPSNDDCPLQTPCAIEPSTNVFAGLSFADLGVAGGSRFTWTWGDGGEFQELRLEFETNVPGPIPALGGASAFAWSRRLRHRLRLRLRRKAA